MDVRCRFVKCLLCDQIFKRITKTHLKKHGKTTDEYKFIFPGAPIVSEELSYTLGKPSREMNKSRRMEISTWAKKFLSNRPKSDEHKKRLSEVKKGKSWGNHTNEHKNYMKEISKKNMELRLQRGWKARKLTEEERLNMSIIAKNNWESGKRKKAIGHHYNKGKKLNLSLEQRKNRSRKRIEYLKNNKTRLTDTSLEITFKEFLKCKQIKFKHQYEIHDKKGSWLFDFYIETLNLLIETDGEYHHSKSLFQINRDIIKEKIAKKHGFNFVRISDKEWCPEIIFETIKFQKNHNKTLIGKRLEKFL